MKQNKLKWIFVASISLATILLAIVISLVAINFNNKKNTPADAAVIDATLSFKSECNNSDVTITLPTSTSIQSESGEVYFRNLKITAPSGYHIVSYKVTIHDDSSSIFTGGTSIEDESADSYIVTISSTVSYSGASVSTYSYTLVFNIEVELEYVSQEFESYARFDFGARVEDINDTHFAKLTICDYSTDAPTGLDDFMKVDPDVSSVGGRDINLAPTEDWKSNDLGEYPPISYYIVLYPKFQRKFNAESWSFESSPYTSDTNIKVTLGTQINCSAKKYNLSDEDGYSGNNWGKTYMCFQITPGNYDNSGYCYGNMSSYIEITKDSGSIYKEPYKITPFYGGTDGNSIKIEDLSSVDFNGVFRSSCTLNFVGNKIYYVHTNNQKYLWVTAVPNENYTFQYWYYSSGGTISEGNHEFSENKTICPDFLQTSGAMSRILIQSENTTKGTVKFYGNFDTSLRLNSSRTFSFVTDMIQENQSLIAEAEAKEGYEFARWKYNGAYIESGESKNISSGSTAKTYIIYACFERKPRIDFEVYLSAWGSVDVNTSYWDINTGETKTFEFTSSNGEYKVSSGGVTFATATPNFGYEFDYWRMSTTKDYTDLEVNGTVQNSIKSANIYSDENYKLSMESRADNYVTLTAYFKRTELPVQFKSADSTKGIVSLESADIEYNDYLKAEIDASGTTGYLKLNGETIVTATANRGYKFKGFGKNSTTSTSLTIKIDSESITIHAIFEARTDAFDLSKDRYSACDLDENNPKEFKSTGMGVTDGIYKSRGFYWSDSTLGTIYAGFVYYSTDQSIKFYPGDSIYYSFDEAGNCCLSYEEKGDAVIKYCVNTTREPIPSPSYIVAGIKINDELLTDGYVIGDSLAFTFCLEEQETCVVTYGESTQSITSTVFGKDGKLSSALSLGSTGYVLIKNAESNKIVVIYPVESLDGKININYGRDPSDLKCKFKYADGRFTDVEICDIIVELTSKLKEVEISVFDKDGKAYDLSTTHKLDLKIEGDNASNKWIIMTFDGKLVLETTSSIIYYAIDPGYGRIIFSEQGASAMVQIFYIIAIDVS